MSQLKEEHKVAADVFKRLGSKWAVLTAMSVDMQRKGVGVPQPMNQQLRMARIKIASGCFSPCEVICSLAQIESQLFSKCHLISESDFLQWSTLLGQAMQGNLDYERIAGIPALEPVVTDCAFLECSCS